MASMESTISRMVNNGKREAEDTSVREASRAFDKVLCRELQRKGITEATRSALYRLEDAFRREMGLDEDGDR